jgi:CRP/FNR family transcriptional regulator
MAVSIEKIPFFQSLNPRELERMRQCLREKNFSKGETLFVEGKSCERVFFVKSGRVKLTRISAAGREQILETLGPGDTCACNPGAREWSCSANAEALTACTVWFLSREEYVRLVEANTALSHTLNNLFARRLQCYGNLIEEVSLKDSRKRLVKFLLDMLADQPSPGNTLSLPFTREELAQRIGVVRETVARQLYQLKRLKLIDIHPRQVLIRNRKGLENLLSQ